MRETDRGDRRDGGSDDRFGGKRRSRYLGSERMVDYKDYELLRRFMTERGKITPARYTGLSAKQQRQVKSAIRRARVMGLLP